MLGQSKNPLYMSEDVVFKQRSEMIKIDNGDDVVKINPFSAAPGYLGGGGYH